MLFLLGFASKIGGPWPPWPPDSVGPVIYCPKVIHQHWSNVSKINHASILSSEFTKEVVFNVQKKTERFNRDYIN